ncbi:MAG: hypothetical protein LUD22_02845, partial [Coprobacillus sp.]|nr:hypothetical protein [Coprobacillus sp.]
GGGTGGSAEQDYEAEEDTSENLNIEVAILDNVSSLYSELSRSALTIWEGVKLEAADEDEDEEAELIEAYLTLDEGLPYGMYSTYDYLDYTYYYYTLGARYEKVVRGSSLRSSSVTSPYTSSLTTILSGYTSVLSSASQFSGKSGYTLDSNDGYILTYTKSSGATYKYKTDTDYNLISLSYESGSTSYTYTEATHEEINTIMSDVDFNAWPISGIQLQFIFTCNGETDTVPDGVSLYYLENEEYTLIEKSADRYVINPTIGAGTHTYSIVMVRSGDTLENAIVVADSLTYTVSSENEGQIVRLTVEYETSMSDLLNS